MSNKKYKVSTYVEVVVDDCKDEYEALDLATDQIDLNELNYDIEDITDRPKITLPVSQWVELYAKLSAYVLEYSSLDPIYNDDGTRKEEKEDEFCDIADSVEEIMKTVLIKEEE